MIGFSVECWPGTEKVKSVAAVETAADVPVGCIFLPDGQTIPEVTPAPLTLDEMLESANTKRDELLAIAALRIAPIQSAVDLAIATNADIANLKTWKQYQVAVNRVPDQPDFPEKITWPDQPVQ